MPTINNSVNNFARMQQLNTAKAPVAFRESQQQAQEAPEERTGMKTSTKVTIGAFLVGLGALAAVYFKSPKAASKIDQAASVVSEKVTEFAGKAKTTINETVIPKTKQAGSVVADKAKAAWNATVDFVKSIPGRFKSSPAQPPST